MTPEEHAVKIAEVEHRAKSNTRRIDKLEQSTEALNSLALSVEVMANEQKHQTEAMLDIKKDVAALDGKLDSKVGELDGKVEALERKPAKRWESVTERIITTLAAALLGFILSQIGIG